MALNVNRNVQDAFYRYKMPRLIAKVEGKGNGVKTVIPNMVEIARALGRPPTYCTKFFGCELGAQTQFDFKNDRYIVNGAHDGDRLQDILDGFIKKFVLCPQCENPETELRVNNKRGIVVSSCKACGHTFQPDNRHKLITFILKNPPNQEVTAQGTSLTKKKAKKSARKEDQQLLAESNGNHSGSSRGVSPIDPVSIEEEDENNGGWGNGNVGDGEDDDGGDWSADVSQEAVSRRMKELTTGIKGLAMDGDAEKSEAQRVDIFHDFVRRKMEEADGGCLDKADAKEILVEAERLEVVNKATIVLCELLFDAAIVSQVKKHKELFMRFTRDNRKAQKYLLGGFEKTIEVYRSSLLNKVPMILKAFYDHDLVEEEVLLEWAKKVSKKHVGRELSELIHRKAEPFITWLKEAEEESSDDDEEEGAVQFDKGVNGRYGNHVNNKAHGSEDSKSDNSKSGDEGGDELIIDDI